MQIKRRRFHRRQRPIVARDPAPAVLHAPRRIPAPGAAAHQEQAHRRLLVHAVGHAAHPVIEPAQPQFAPVPRQIAVDGGSLAEIDIARPRFRTVAMRPRPHDEPHRAALAFFQPCVIVGGGADVGIVPTRHMNLRHVRELVIPAFGVNAELLPVIAECAVRPLLE